LKILGTASIWSRFSKSIGEHPHARPGSNSEKRNKSGVSKMTKNFFLIIISPSKHCWCSTQREIWKAKRTGTIAVKTHIRQLILDYWLNKEENVKRRIGFEILPQSRQCQSPVSFTSSGPEIPFASTGESGKQLPTVLLRANTPRITTFSRPWRPMTSSSTALGSMTENQK
jgi:hypothetical protein